MSNVLDREAILGADDLATESLDVPEWGGVVQVRELTSEERDAYEASCLEGSGSNQRVRLDNIRAKLVVRSLVDEDGNRVFTDADAGALGKKSAAAMDRIFAVAQRLSKITAEDVEELAKNSESGPAGLSAIG